MRIVDSDNYLSISTEDSFLKSTRQNDPIPVFMACHLFCRIIESEIVPFVSTHHEHLLQLFIMYPFYRSMVSKEVIIIV